MKKNETYAAKKNQKTPCCELDGMFVAFAEGEEPITFGCIKCFWGRNHLSDDILDSGMVAFGWREVRHWTRE